MHLALWERSFPNKIMNRIVITRIKKEQATFLLYLVFDENRTLLDLQVFEEENSLLGQIYVGYVEKIVPNIQAAFLKIGDGKKCYLPLTDIKQPIYAKKQSEKKVLSEGDCLLVQVTKDAVKTKDAIVSTKLTLHGKYCFLTTENARLGVSQKLTEDESKRLLSLLTEVCAGHEELGYGMVLRTNARDVSANDLTADLQEVIASYRNLLNYGIHKKAFELLYQPMSGHLQKIKAIDASVSFEILTDQEDVFAQIDSAFPQYVSEKKLLRHKDDVISLLTLYSIRKHLEECTQKKVWLKSGANLIIEQLETLTFIDINSSKNVSKKEDTLFYINMEAAEEIARQIRLRNLSGMILIDFINMKSKEQEEELIAFLKKQISKDLVPTKFVDITKLGLVELTRKKGYKSLKEILEGA